jgi:hypothetical protein
MKGVDVTVGFSKSGATAWLLAGLTIFVPNIDIVNGVVFGSPNVEYK